jgi:hypothetical protein
MAELLDADGVTVPTVGRIVHVVGARRGVEPVAAIVTAVHPNLTVEVHAFPAAGGYMPGPEPRLVHDPTGTNTNSWRWPPRV